MRARISFDPQIVIYQYGYTNTDTDIKKYNRYIELLMTILLSRFFSLKIIRKKYCRKLLIQLTLDCKKHFALIAKIPNPIKGFTR